MSSTLLALVLLGCRLTIAVADDKSIWNQEFTSAEISTLVANDATYLHSAFNAWSVYFERDYNSTQEQESRFDIWLTNLKVISTSNDVISRSYKLAMNQFGDWTADDYSNYVHRNGMRGRPRSVTNNSASSLSTPPVSESVPSAWDWDQEGKVTPVKNQGNCGSCWAFSSAATEECNYAIKYNTLRSLSEQQYVDCVDWCGGCNGCEWDFYVFEYTQRLGGTCLESDYPYVAPAPSKCNDQNCGTLYNQNIGWGPVPRHNETALKNAVYNKGCISIAIDANNIAFSYYSSGVLDGNCPSSDIDHYVTLVGYGTTNSGEDYWNVKNSWGTDWGEKGYVQICRNCDKNGRNGQCGILMYPDYPTY